MLEQLTWIGLTMEGLILVAYLCVLMVFITYYGDDDLGGFL